MTQSDSQQPSTERAAALQPVAAEEAWRLLAVAEAQVAGPWAEPAQDELPSGAAAASLSLQG